MSARISNFSKVSLFVCTAALASCGGSSGGGAPSVSFSTPAAASTIHLGQSVTLSWTSANTTSCAASSSSAIGSSFAGTQAASGSASVAPTATGSVTFTLSCTGASGSASATTQTIAVGPSILSGLSKITTIGSTLDPTEMGGNPYGLVIAPMSSGLITAGDLVVCNFNDGATNTQGAGTTIVGLHPTAGAAPYRIAQSAQLQGCNALTMLPDDSISAAAYTSNLNLLVAPSGTIGTPFASDAFNQPWGEAYVPAASGRTPALYTTGVALGSINRIALTGDAQSSFTEIAKGFCTSGVPGAIYSPAGLTYDASIDTLYIVDTSSYSVVSFSNVSSIGADGIVVNGSCGGAPHTPTAVPTFTGASAASAKVIAHGGQFNAPLSSALLSDGDLVVGNADIDGPATTNLLFEISPALGFVGAPLQLDNGAPGALFGIVTAVDGSGNQIVYFNDDNANAVMSLTKP